MSAGKKKQLAKVGSKLGPDLTVLGVIDGGGKEPVYIVWHHDAWCPMACKVMQSYEDAEREAAVLTEFAHPNIVRLLDVMRPQYLLMPFLEGPSLADVIDTAPKKRLTLSNALRVAVHIGAALHHVHSRGYIHLDIKPDNVIVAAGGLPVLFDFGTARRLGARRPQEVIGTNAYIAPEECRLGQSGPAADVFSFAVTVYEMLSGERPFGKGTPDQPFPQLEGEARPLSDVVSNVPRELECLLFACLERDPAFRPDLAEILPALNRMIRTGPRMWPDGFEPGRAARRSAPCRVLAGHSADSLAAMPITLFKLC